MEFETEWQLQEWRKIESQHFDSDGKAYAGQNMSLSTQEQMFKLINQLDSELTIIEQSYGTEKNILNQFFNNKSDANKYLLAEEQEDLEKEFGEWCQKTVRE